MNMTATPATVGGKINERAMLVDLDISHWQPIKTDEKVSREIATAHGAKRDAGNYRKRLVDKSALTEIRAIVREAYWYHVNITLPWMHNGARILNSTAFWQYETHMREIQARFNKAVDRFVDGYPTLVNNESRRLGTLFNFNDYPSHADIRKRFRISYEVLPVPTADDFRVNLGVDEVERIKRQIDANNTVAVNEAMKDVYGRVAKAVTNMAERLRAYTVTPGGVEHGFRDSLVDNVSELINLLPSLNVTGDPTLDAITKRMQDELVKFNGDRLRSDANARAETAAAADAIFASVSQFMA